MARGGVRAEGHRRRRRPILFGRAPRLSVGVLRGAILPQEREAYIPDLQAAARLLPVVVLAAHFGHAQPSCR